MKDRLTRVHIALNKRQIRALDELSKKLMLDRTNVMRMALARLVESEKMRQPDIPAL